MNKSSESSEAILQPNSVYTFKRPNQNLFVSERNSLITDIESCNEKVFKVLTNELVLTSNDAEKLLLPVQIGLKKELILCNTDNQLFYSLLIPLTKNVESRVKIITNSINPINEIENNVVKDLKFIEGSLWGEIRKSHEEGLVINHIKDVLNNVEDLFDYSQNTNYPIISEDKVKLRFIAILHDTFKKFETNSSKGKAEFDHGQIATDFAKKYIKDESLLQIIEKHDDIFRIWRACFVRKEFDTVEAEKLLEQLVEDLGRNLRLYNLFFMCDSLTGTKEPYNVEWFHKNIFTSKDMREENLINFFYQNKKNNFLQNI